MATLIPNVTISEFKKLKVSQMKELSSCEIMSDGEYLFTFINGNLEASGNVRDNAEQWGLVSNSVGGKSIEEILEAELVSV